MSRDGCRADEQGVYPQPNGQQHSEVRKNDKSARGRGHGRTNWHRSNWWQGFAQDERWLTDAGWYGWSSSDARAGSREWRQRGRGQQQRQSDEVAANYDAVTKTFKPLVSSASGTGFREINNQAVQRLTESVLDSQRKGLPCLIVDVACGKAGGVPKYLDYVADGGKVILVDISSASIEEAKRRLGQNSRLATQAAQRWISFEFEVADCFQPEYWQRFGDHSVSVISCQFALHYAFANVNRARETLREINRVLVAGTGLFFGTTVDSSALQRLAQTQQDEDHFRIAQLDSVELGSRYVFELPGHVEPTAEFVLPMSDLRAAGESVGLRACECPCVTWCNFGDVVDFSRAPEPDQRLSSLYCTFAFTAAAPDLPSPPASTLTVPGLPAPGRAVAVYTGTFDPIHVNHLNLCRYLLEKQGFAEVHLFPNDDSPLKPFATCLERRASMAKIALQSEGLADRCTVADTRNAGGDWKSREKMCRSVSGNRAEVALLLGVDSFAKAVERSSGKDSGRGRGKGKSHVGIFAFAKSGFKILVCPREGYKTPATPSELEPCVKILGEYEDIVQTSSSTIREQLLSLDALSAGLLAVPSPVLSYIREQHLYQPARCHKRTILILGPPGSGKTELGNSLAQGVQRAEVVSWNEGFDSSSEEAMALRVRIQRDDGGVFVIDGAQATDLQKADHALGSVDCILELHCSKDSCADRHRYNRYIASMSIQKEILKSFAGSGRLHLDLHKDQLEERDACKEALRLLKEAGWPVAE